MDEKKLHTRKFQQKGISRNMRCKLLQKRSTRKTTECSKHLQHIAIEKDIFSELFRCIFQISLNYIKLVIPKILFILVSCNFNFHFKITWPPQPQQNYPLPTKIKISDKIILMMAKIKFDLYLYCIGHPTPKYCSDLICGKGSLIYLQIWQQILPIILQS